MSVINQMTTFKIIQKKQCTELKYADCQKLFTELSTSHGLYKISCEEDR